jgi:hypothetical protein
MPPTVDQSLLAIAGFGVAILLYALQELKMNVSRWLLVPLGIFGLVLIMYGLFPYTKSAPYWVWSLLAVGAVIYTALWNRRGILSKLHGAKWRSPVQWPLTWPEQEVSDYFPPAEMAKGVRSSGESQINNVEQITITSTALQPLKTASRQLRENNQGANTYSPWKIAEELTEEAITIKKSTGGFETSGHQQLFLIIIEHLSLLAWNFQRHWGSVKEWDEDLQTKQAAEVVNSLNILLHQFSSFLRDYMYLVEHLRECIVLIPTDDMTVPD